MFSKQTVPGAPAPESCWKVLSEITSLHTDLLSARCTVDRLRFRRGPSLVAECLDQRKLDEIRSNLVAILGFVESVEKLLGPPDPNSKGRTRQ